MTARLKDLYEKQIKKQLMQELSLNNVNQVPRLDKIVLNMGLGEAASDRGKVDGALKDLTQISGQKPIPTKARKSVATFKLREGMNIGCKVTLRKERMYEFLDRLINISLPRVRDFHGISTKSFDKRGNYALGIKEQIVFPEINYDDVDAIRGMDIIICTTAKTDEAGLALLKKFNFPFKEETPKAAKTEDKPTIEVKEETEIEVSKKEEKSDAEEKTEKAIEELKKEKNVDNQDVSNEEMSASNNEKKDN